jgi:16S rRNA (cytidine1402-2'-O)-methyltransferase
MSIKMSILYICATPIGNLNDASFRLIEVLKSADFIIAEDTRTAAKLLSRFEIKKSPGSMVSYQDYASAAKTGLIIDRIKQSQISALISESGIPAIQDPGYKIIKNCIENNIILRAIPGPNAALSALVLSGLPTDSFIFAGFLPKTDAKRKEKIFELAYLPFTLIFYESPLRIKNLLQELLEILGDRNACIAREITKIYEETIRGTITEILKIVEARPSIKGEIVFVVEGYKKQLIKVFEDSEIKKEYIKLVKQNIGQKDIFKIIQSRYDIDRQKLYNITKISK